MHNFGKEKNKIITDTLGYRYRFPSRPRAGSGRVSASNIPGYTVVVSNLPMDLNNTVDGLLGLTAFRRLCKVDNINHKCSRVENISRYSSKSDFMASLSHCEILQTSF